MQKPRGPDNNQQSEGNSGYAKTQAPWQSLLFIFQTCHEWTFASRQDNGQVGIMQFKFEFV